MDVPFCLTGGAMFVTRHNSAANINDTVASARLLLIQKASTAGRAVQLSQPSRALLS
jgi:hypothetical protein